MFDYVLNIPLNLVAIKVWVDKEPTFLIHMKKQQKIKALLNGTDVVNVEKWAVLELPRSQNHGIL